MTDVLRQEIEKLGGTDKDFELVNSVKDNDDEEWKARGRILSFLFAQFFGFFRTIFPNS